ncbi:hypothetical protein PUN28_006810 [Cardiocondyla obscurior]|uniref:Transmembrane protein n=1 Tax=Cardiocondyla obscurior TaxID=286306 RepID=A0AAW2G534_9HYME
MQRVRKNRFLRVFYLFKCYVNRVPQKRQARTLITRSRDKFRISPASVRFSPLLAAPLIKNVRYILPARKLCFKSTMSIYKTGLIIKRSCISEKKNARYFSDCVDNSQDRRVSQILNVARSNFSPLLATVFFFFLILASMRSYVFLSLLFFFFFFNRRVTERHDTSARLWCFSRVNLYSVP